MFGEFTTSTYRSGKTVSKEVKNLQGQQLDIAGDQSATLAWTNQGSQNVVVSGSSDFSLLTGFKGAMLSLRNDFFGQGGEKIIISGEKRQELDRRFILLEHEIEGLLKRRINFSVKDQQGGHRIMDYTGILNEKQNQIVELQKKIQNFQERLRRASKREKELEDQVSRLYSAIKVLEKPNFNRQDIERLFEVSSQSKVALENYQRLQSQITSFASLARTQFDKLKSQGIRCQFDTELGALLRANSLQTSIVNGVVQLVDYRDRVVEVPVQDSRTKHLIHMLAVQMKKYFQKYPKLKEECDARLYEFFQQQLIDVIEVDELERVVQIVKYVPDIVRVQNVYAYSSEKSRKVEFHLRVLIKALLEELEKIKRKSGLVLEIDEGIIGMINAEIMGVVDVDDILKVFRVVPKIVEVEKIVEKIVDRVIQIPQVITIEKIVQKIIEVPKIQQIERIVHVPIEIIKYVDNVIEKYIQVEKIVQKIVQVPRIMQKVVERVVEIPKVVQVDVVRQKIVQVQKPVIVEKIVNHTIPQIKQVQIIRQKIVQVQRIVERIVEVEKIVQKIVQKVITVPQIVQVKVYEEKIVKSVEYRNAREVINHIEHIPEIVEIYIEKAVPVIQTIEKIVQVPQTIEKIVQVHVEVPTIKQIKIYQQKIVYRDRIKQVEKHVNHTVTLIKEVQKIIEKRIQVPFIQQRIVRVPQIITQIVVERIEIPRIIQVDRHVDKIVEVNKIIQVEKPVNHYITQTVPIKIMVEKIVEVPRTIERIKQVRVCIDKIIEKMVQVPKVVQVEKIVEKIVVVPRVIEKIVEVPQIVQKVVDRLVETTTVREVEKIVQVPVIQQRIVEVEVVKNIYHQIEKIVERVVEKLVPVERVIQNSKIVKELSDKVVQVRVEVPRQVHVDKIVTKIMEVEKVIQIQRPVSVPVEVPVPYERIVEKLVPVERQIEKIVQVPQIIEKIVQVKVQNTNVVETTKVIEKPIIVERIKQVQKIVPYINEIIKEVPTFKQKIVETKETITRVKEVPTYIEKIVVLTNQIPKIYEIQRYQEKLIQVPQIVELHTQIPVICKVNQVVESLVDRIVEIPIIMEKIVSVPTLEQKIVAVQNKDTVVKEVVVNRDKIIEKDVYIQKFNTYNHIEYQLKTVDRFQQRIVPVFSMTQKIVEVPYILQKIVQKIVIMPQIVEVLKYVHEIVEEETLGIAVGVDIRLQESRYKQLYGKVRINFETLLVELRKMKVSQPGFKVQIEIIEAFLIELDKLMSLARIVQVDKEVIVEKQKNIPILVPTKDSVSIRNELSLSLLVEKLVAELKRIKRDNSNIKLGLDEDVSLIFFSQFLDGKSSIIGEDLNKQLISYKQSVYNKLLTYGKTWSTDHETIFNTVLQERFMMANIIKQANLQIERSKAISDQRAEGLKRIKQANDLINGRFANFEKDFSDVLTVIGSDSRYSSSVTKMQGLFGGFKNVLVSNLNELVIDEPTITLGSIHGTDGNFLRLQSAFRALQKENDVLRARLLKVQEGKVNIHAVEDRERIIESLRKQIVALSSDMSSLRSRADVTVNVSGNSQQYEIKIRTLNSKIQQIESQLRTTRVDYEGQIRSKNNYIRQLQEKIERYQKGGSSRITDQTQGQSLTVNTTPIELTSSDAQHLSSSVHSSSSSINETRNIQAPISTYQSGRTATYTSGTGGNLGTNLATRYGQGYTSGTSGTSGISGTNLTAGYQSTSKYTSGMSSSGTYGTGMSSSGTYGTTGYGTGTAGSSYTSGQYTSGTTGYTSGTGYTSTRGYGTTGTTGTNVTGTTGTVGTTDTSGKTGTSGSGSGLSSYQSYYAKKS